MKIRNGFVSNSSSSSFIIILPHEPKSREELHKMLFTDYQKIISKYDMSASVDDMSKQIWNDLSSEDSIPTKEKIESLFKHLYYIHSMEMDDSYIGLREEISDDVFVDKDLYYKYLGLSRAERTIWNKYFCEAYKAPEYKKIEEKIEELENKIFEEDYEGFMNKYKDKFIRIVEYSDNDGELGVVMEHGDIFRNIESITINNH